MLLKRIVCEVPPDRRAAFSAAQEHWRAIAILDGFCGQLGGWSASQPNLACVFGFWRDQVALDSFMRHEHDPIVRRSNQSKTYTSIGVSDFDIGRITPPVADATQLRIFGRSIEFLRWDDLLLTITIHSDSLDLDTISIEPAWTVEPSRRL